MNNNNNNYNNNNNNIVCVIVPSVSDVESGSFGSYYMTNPIPDVIQDCEWFDTLTKISNIVFKKETMYHRDSYFPMVMTSILFSLVGFVLYKPTIENASVSSVVAGCLLYEHKRQCETNFKASSSWLDTKLVSINNQDHFKDNFYYFQKAPSFCQDGTLWLIKKNKNK